MEGKTSDKWTQGPTHIYKTPGLLRYINTKKLKKTIQMENKLLSFNEFETLYESFGFITEAEKPEFTPEKTQVTNDDIISLFGGKEVDEALNVKAFAPIKKGEKSERVKQLQKDLGLEADGVFGDATEKKVKEFQTTNKLAVDGKAGVQTLTKMLELKGDKTPEKTIETKYIIKTEAQAKGAGIDPELLKIYDITIVNNGEKQYVILVPKKDAAAKVKALEAKGSFKGFEWLAEGAKYAGKALVYTAIGLAVVPLVIANAMIAGVASAAVFMAGGAAFVMGAAIQGIVNIANWMAKAGKAAYAKVSNAADELYKGFCTGFAKVAKSSVQAFTAFMAAVKTVGFIATGIALTAFKAVASVLSPAVKALVQGAKDAAAFIANGLAWIGKNVKNGVVALKNSVAKGWQNVKTATQKAWDGAKSAAKSAGDAMYKAAGDAYNSASNFLSNMYAAGKKFWESLEDISGDPIFEDIDFTIA
jgi:peptidoglycan hydrolase-like protein with peptidoglycan-binding domain